MAPLTVNLRIGITVSNVSVINILMPRRPSPSPQMPPLARARLGHDGRRHQRYDAVHRKGCLATPVATPAAGTYTSSQSVVLSDTTPGSSIYYSINGGTAIKYTTAIAVAASETIQAVAVVPGTPLGQSAALTASYTINPAVATPIVTPASGNLTAPKPS